jgi:hypothetical protein
MGMFFMPETMDFKMGFAFVRTCARVRLKVCQNIARVSPGGVRGWDLGLDMFTHKAPCRVRVSI